MQLSRLYFQTTYTYPKIRIWTDMSVYILTVVASYRDISNNFNKCMTYSDPFLHFLWGFYRYLTAPILVYLVPVSTASRHLNNRDMLL